MNESETRKLFNIISEHSDRDATEISEQDRFSEDYGLDSIDSVGLLHDINSCFKIDISEKQASDLKTVADMIVCIDKQTQKRP